MRRRRGCDGAGVLLAFAGAVAHLGAHVDEINALNVFPVPDGDTGSNMAATVRAALEEAQRVPEGERTVERVAAAIAFGSLMGARGNSGVILSQIFRGMATGLESKRHLNGPDLAHALTRGTETAYAAVVRPVEGTILTVIREAAVAAVEVAEREPELERHGAGLDQEHRLEAEVESAAGRGARCQEARRALPCRWLLDAART
ncbi:MAG: DAK2 domain-containing protein, partial [Candidatus Limnocylindrales bacterium]